MCYSTVFCSTTASSTRTCACIHIQLLNVLPLSNSLSLSFCVFLCPASCMHTLSRPPSQQSLCSIRARAACGCLFWHQVAVEFVYVQPTHHGRRSIYPFCRDGCAASRVCLLQTLMCSVDGACACGGKKWGKKCSFLSAPPAVTPLPSGIRRVCCSLAPTWPAQHISPAAKPACCLVLSRQSQLFSCGCFSHECPDYLCCC